MAAALTEPTTWASDKRRSAAKAGRVKRPSNRWASEVAKQSLSFSRRDVSGKTTSSTTSTHFLEFGQRRFQLVETILVSHQGSSTRSNDHQITYAE